MRIGISCYSTFGGSGVVATEVGKALAARGHEVHLLSPAIPPRLWEQLAVGGRMVVPVGPAGWSQDLVLARRLWQGAEFVFNPSITRGFGLSNSTGVAAFPNNEAFRLGSTEPAFFVPRAFLRQTFALSSDTVPGDGDPLRFVGAVGDGPGPSGQRAGAVEVLPDLVHDVLRHEVGVDVDDARQAQSLDDPAHFGCVFHRQSSCQRRRPGRLGVCGIPTPI